VTCNCDGFALLIPDSWLGLKLLGFKERTELAFEDNVKHSIFIYPNELVGNQNDLHWSDN
jgi:hypothetical protein